MANQDSITPVRGFEDVEEAEKVEMVEEMECERDLERNSPADKNRRKKVFILGEGDSPADLNCGGKGFVLCEKNPCMDHGPKRVFVLSFRNLQLCRIERLQRSILDLSTPKAGVDSKTGEERHMQLDELLKRYAKAVRDYETLSENATPNIPHGDCTSNISPDALAALRKMGKELSLKEIETFWVRELDKRGTHRQHIAFGHICGVFLFFPMLIMAIHPSLLKSLVTTAGALIIFALFITGVSLNDNFPSFEPKDVLAAVATYAAVFVVFVGASLPKINS